MDLSHLLTSRTVAWIGLACIALSALPDELGADVLAAIGRRGDVLMSGVAEADALDAAAHKVGAVAMRKPLDRARIVDHLTAALAA